MSADADRASLRCGVKQAMRPFGSRQGLGIAPVRGRSSLICPAETGRRRGGVLLFADGARHRQDRRSGAGASLAHPSRPLAGVERLRLGRPQPAHDKGMIADPVNKAKSVVFTEEGLKCAEELFRVMFTKPE